MPELMFAWATLAAIAVAVVEGFYRRERATFISITVAAGCAWAAAVARVIATGHLPKFGTFEESLATAAVVLVHAGYLARRPDRALPAGVTAAVAGLLLLHGTMFSPARHPLTISELSIWLDLHVIAAWLTAAAFALATGGAIWLLRDGARAAEHLLTRALQVGFLFHSLLMLLGAWYGYQLFGSAVTLDPIETLAVIAWVVSASVLHLRAYRGLSGRAYGVLGLVAVVLLFVSFRLIVHLSPASTYHIIDMDLRLHF